MSSNLFKLRYAINYDLIGEGELLDNTNTVFIHTYVGDDFSGDGTREHPFKGMFRAGQKSGMRYCVFRGVINELFSNYLVIMGDDSNQILLSSNYTFQTNRLANLKVDTIKQMFNVNYTSFLTGVSFMEDLPKVDQLICYYTLFKKYICGDYPSKSALIQCTVIDDVSTFREGNIVNTIIVKSFNSIYVAIDGISFKYLLFPSDCVFSFNNIVIQTPIWSNDSKANVQLLRNAYLTAGMIKADADRLFAKDSFGNETCRIVKEQRNGGASGNIFNAYNVDGTVSDYSLNPASNNEALYASDLGGYVGCFKPASKIDLINDLSEAINVNVDGTDSSEQGLLLMRKMISGVKSIEFDTTSNQIWNRCTSNTVNIPNGVKYNGSNVQSDDGSAFGYYFGKHQNLMNPTSLFPTDTLEPNTIYKVCNLNRDIYSAVIFNGIQYLPDYFFKTGTSVLNFTLLNSGSGTNVKKVLASPLESIEILPFDDMDTPAVDFPRYSSPLFGNTQMLYHKIGANIDKPVLFSEVVNDKIAYYDNWAVTNADQEFVTLANDTENYYYKIPVLKFMRVELNAHFNADYDQ